MKKRKHLCLLTADIKDFNAKRLVTGVVTQCKKYDYDVSIFSTPTTLKYFIQEYTDGAANIFNLVNFECFDGIIVDTLTLSNTFKDIITDLYATIKKYAKCPVVNLCVEFEGYKTVVSQNEQILRNMCKHMIEEHGYEKLCILTGPKGNVEAEQRLEIFLDEIEKHGLKVKPEHCFYGDFWYSSGEKLAEQIVSAEVEKPDAVICAGDYMGLGLINKLVKFGVKVPEDIAVIGFESVKQAMLNDISLTSYSSNSAGTAAEAVDYIRSIIEPNKELQPIVCIPQMHFLPGRSCGCKDEVHNLIRELGPEIYREQRDYSDENLSNNIDIGYLMEGDCYERLCSSQDVEECIFNICDSAYNVLPFEKFYLCLRENWDDLSVNKTSGFPDQMKLVIERNESTGERFCSNKDGSFFDTMEMLPGLFDARKEPSVFYFMSVHFNDTTFGYMVLQRNLDGKRMDIVFRNWIRFICSSLEMIRIRETYLKMSLKDSMTGLTNKRGMYEALNRMESQIKPEESVYVAVIDMDGLKYVNDNFGHIWGDECLKRLTHVINLVTKDNEVAVRAGGDEFYIIGVGEYSKEILEQKIKEFEQILEEYREINGIEYRLSASIGNTARAEKEGFDIDEMIQEADERMYRYKYTRKKARLS